MRARWGSEHAQRVYVATGVRETTKQSPHLATLRNWNKIITKYYNSRMPPMTPTTQTSFAILSPIIFTALLFSKILRQAETKPIKNGSHSARIAGLGVDLTISLALAAVTIVLMFDADQRDTKYFMMTEQAKLWHAAKLLAFSIVILTGASVSTWRAITKTGHWAARMFASKEQAAAWAAIVIAAISNSLLTVQPILSSAATVREILDGIAVGAVLGGATYIALGARPAIGALSLIFGSGTLGTILAAYPKNLTTDKASILLEKLQTYGLYETISAIAICVGIINLARHGLGYFFSINST